MQPDTFVSPLARAVTHAGTVVIPLASAVMYAGTVVMHGAKGVTRAEIAATDAARAATHEGTAVSQLPGDTTEVASGVSQPARRASYGPAGLAHEPKAMRQESTGPMYATIPSGEERMRPLWAPARRPGFQPGLRRPPTIHNPGCGGLRLRSSIPAPSGAMARAGAECRGVGALPMPLKGLGNGCDLLTPG